MDDIFTEEKKEQLKIYGKNLSVLLLSVGLILSGGYMVFSEYNDDVDAVILEITPDEETIFDIGIEASSDDYTGGESIVEGHSEDFSVPDFPERTDKEWDTEMWPHENDGGHKIVNVNDEEINSENVEKLVMEGINDHRSENGVDELEYSLYLASTSRSHSFDMYENDYLAHVSQDGEEPRERFGSERKCAWYYGENVAQTQIGGETIDHNGDTKTVTSEKDVSDIIIGLWKESAEHNKVLLEDQSDVGGVGVYIGESDDPGNGNVYDIYATYNTCRYTDNPIDD